MTQEQTIIKTESSSTVLSQTLNQFLTFRLDGEEYGMDILKVQEVLAYDSITPIVNALELVKWVVSLHGINVPIIDMRARYQSVATEHDQSTAVIILNGAESVMGIVVDGVTDVINLDLEKMRPTPESGSVIDTKFIMGLSAIEDRLVMLVDIEKLISSTDMGLTGMMLNIINSQQKLF